MILLEAGKQSNLDNDKAADARERVYRKYILEHAEKALANYNQTGDPACLRPQTSA